ncbi:MAG: hypothetical protein AAGI48_10440 [Verrucomicrobiota bacterium]
MKHFVNLSLLLFFISLVASGLLRYLAPFELITTRIHIVSGLALVVLVGFHLLNRGKYFFNQFTGRGQRRQRSPKQFLLPLSVLAVWGYLLAASFLNWWPVTSIIAQSHESRHVREIFRSDRKAVHEVDDLGLRIKRASDTDASLRLDFDWGEAYPKSSDGTVGGKRQPQIAIWAETEDGTVLETLFLSETAAFADEVKWGDQTFSRADILPVWHARYSKILEEAVDQKEMEEELDAVTSATPVRDFTMEGYLRMESQPFTVLVEINAPDDPNRYYHHEQETSNEGYMPEGMGQPSIIYEAFVFPEDDQRHFLLKLSGHSGKGSENDGQVFFETDQLTTAKELVEKILLEVDWGSEK